MSGLAHDLCRVRGGAAVLLLFSLLGARDAAAHAVGLSRGQYRPLPAGLEAELVFAAGELLPPLAQSAPRILERLHVSDASGGPCVGRLKRLELNAEDAVTLSAEYRCSAPPAELGVELDFWDEVSPGHRHVVGGDVYQREQPRFELPGAPLAASPRHATLPAPATLPFEPTLRGWVELGIEHILTGYDHLAFLLALLLVAGTLRDLAASVSVFTLAHSVTLALAALGVYAPPSALVECMIALSICYVGIENLTPRGRRPRFRLVFAFGLIHGFGFAGALREIGVRSAQTPLALLGFNLGVELGQLALLLAAYPLVRALRRGAWFQLRGVPALSTLIALAGALWFVSRV